MIQEGPRGVVYKGLDRSSQMPVCVNKLRLRGYEEGPSVQVLRETSILLEIVDGATHPNIVRLLDVVEYEQHLYLVFEYLDSNLLKHMREHPHIYEDPRHIKHFLREMLSGVAHCHGCRVLHRDLKPENLLIDQRSNALKLADFGSARTFDIPVRTHSHEVVSLWYRPPEMLLRSPHYSTPVDVWAIGCIFAEMVNQRVLFRGDSEIGQILKIFSIIGTPNEDIWPGVMSLPDFKPLFCEWAPQLANEVPNLGETGLDLLGKMLQLDPDKRITARKALEHEYFKEPS